MAETNQSVEIVNEEKSIFKKFLRFDDDWVDLSFTCPPLTSVPLKYLTPKLKEINLSNNELTEFPEELYQCKELMHLYLSFNKITNLPDIGEKFPNLVTLDLSYNNLVVLPDLSKFKSLEVLILSSNKIESVPESIGELKQLKQVYLDNNVINEMPKSFQSLTLNVSRLEGNKLHQKASRVLSGLISKRLLLK
ncbi:s-cell enriched with leucine-rich repeat-containing protein slra-related [Anaeramoeba flamelloides]|uniref:S-cell enriched with leucine-rich repeat-containing protein slra-related n=1 Tax=Anaeramoeba flamelloides TaxID=1746091 RepID=A0AAV7YSK3_9EUKA|nr:s-cell enriched with leucine-rich repeat-containing protein slra-related [Anaeramoeba flamelloides]KAJ6238740.1 s-cell enriched with leucine-rich repeat-containing protein slra-related [Anaeramoeba flamelloides]